MKLIRCVGAALLFWLTTPQAAQAALLFYADFDNITSQTFANYDPYPLNPSEPMPIASNVYFASYRSQIRTHNGVTVKVPDGTDGTSFPASPGPQGGSAMFVESGDIDSTESGIHRVEEGLFVEMLQPLPLQDLTWEVIFWAATNDIPGNIGGIQGILSDEWPTGPYIRTNLRIRGASAPPPYTRNLTLHIFNDTQETVLAAFDPGPLPEKQWHLVQYTFDYNDANPANSVMTLYVNGAVVTSTTLNATPTMARTKILGHGPGSNRFLYDPSWPSSSGFFVGGTANLAINQFESRGLLGAVDAVAISTGVLGPGTFVLPAGYTPPAAVREKLWMLYE
jgi:hypothetical protein